MSCMYIFVCEVDMVRRNKCVFVLLLSVCIQYMIQVAQYCVQTWVKTSCKNAQMTVQLTVASAAEQF